MSARKKQARKGVVSAKKKKPSTCSGSVYPAQWGDASELVEPRKLMFRIWDREAEAFAENSCSLHCFSDWVLTAFSGELVDFVGAIGGKGEGQIKSPPPKCFFRDGKLWRGERYVVTQYSGVNAAKGTPVFEGDIVRFKYYVGDMAWSEMGEREKEEQSKMMGVKVGRVRKDILTNNLVIEVPSKIGIEYYPLEYAIGEGCSVVGNIFENADPRPKRRSK